MKPTRKMQQLLERMARIERMERGKLCKMTGRPHYNHQTWRNGRNEVRYVPADELAALQEAIEGYQLFIKLAEQYADEVIQLTRRERKSKKKRQNPS
jgi:predicted ArsR family transcriptional regulator